MKDFIKLHIYPDGGVIRVRASAIYYLYKNSRFTCMNIVVGIVENSDCIHIIEPVERILELLEEAKGGE